MKPREDEVVVFKDFFPAGLRFPLDPSVVDIFVRYGVFLHHMTPNSFARANLFMWLLNTCRLAPTPENFARVMRVHYQPKSISVRGSDGISMEMEPQYGCHSTGATPSPFNILLLAPSGRQRISGRGTVLRSGFTTRFPSTRR